ncbi:hypothetical protein KAW53_07860, partial [Candidatus Bathyarchaeota archaeon]|nr:hypothetical protein [Candidatus Bathyarchaeota archaeon]
IPTYIGISIIFTGNSAIPKILETPSISLDNITIPMGNTTIVIPIPISTAEINEIIDKTFSIVNLTLFLAISVVLISAGGGIMGKGVSLIKEIRLRAVKASVKEISEELRVEEEETR